MAEALPWIVVAAVAALALLVWLRQERSRGDAKALAALAGRLDQMASSQAAVQGQLAEQLQAQERALAKAMDERMARLGGTVGESLSRSASDTAKTLTELRERLAVIDAAQANMTQLSTQVVALQDILSNKQARGAFGEIQLENLVKAALPPDAYEFQFRLVDRVVDCLLKLPNPPGPIAIDAKFPLEAYRAVVGAPDEVQRTLARKQLASDVMVHVRAIRDRYIVPGETAESALLFLPSEAIYAELHANLPEVVQQSYRERVWIVSPTTLMATLNTVRAVLRDARMREQAHQIQREVGMLLEDVGRLDDRVSKLQRHFDLSLEDLRQIRITTEKVTRRAGRIEEVDVGPDETARLTAPAAE
jgi:DNA recombination protein RmuC